MSNELLTVFVVGLSAAFFLCDNKVYKGPNSKDIVGAVFRLHDGSHVKFKPYVVIGPV